MKKFSLILLAVILSFTIYSILYASSGNNIFQIKEAEAGIIPMIDEMVDVEIQENTNITSNSSQQSSMKKVENSTDLVPEFIGIQHSLSGVISEINSTAYSLELNDVSDKTILFAERPDRLVASITTSDFIENWSIGKDNFVVDPPNAILVINEKEKQQDIVILGLFNPVYDSDNKILKYVIPLDNATSTELPNEFGKSTLVIDSISNDSKKYRVIPVIF